MSDSSPYDALYVYTMSRPGFVLQHVVDDEWCASVWEAFRDSRESVAQLLREYGIE
jgi:hypothetical protein